MLKINNMSISKGKKLILDDISLEFEKGKIYGILGANGAGKSTLLDGIFQLEKNYNMTLDDLKSNDVKLWQENIGYMLQNFHTHSGLSALEVVLLGAYNALNIKMDDNILQDALKLLEDFNILRLANIQVNELSGGQRQMISFAQVLLKNPKVLLLDEPVSALDLKHQCVLLEALKNTTKTKNLISLVVIHDLNLASLFCDEVVIIHDSKVYEKGAIKDIISKELIREIYGVNVEIMDVNGRCFIQVINSI